MGRELSISSQALYSEVRLSPTLESKETGPKASPESLFHDSWQFLGERKNLKITEKELKRPKALLPIGKKMSHSPK